MKQRIISAIVMAIIGVTAIVLGGYVFGAFIFIIAAMALYEFYTAFEKRECRPVKICGAFFLLMLALMIIFKTPSYTELIVKLPFGIGPRNLFEPIFYIALMCIFAATVFKHEKHDFADVGVTLFGGFYTVYLVSYAVILRSMDHGIWLVILPLVTAVAADTFALFVGMTLGKHKLIPKVSPKKTVEGAIGGFIGAIIFTLIYFFIMQACDVSIGLKWFDFIIIGAVGGVVAQIGDLTASSIKRYLGIKDFGKLIPGHGGVMDRIDSYLVVFPIVFLYMVLRGVC